MAQNLESFGVFRKPIIEERKRRNNRMNIVRQRCLIYINALKKSGFSNEIPLESAKIVFSQVIGVCDRTSLKAYFGSQPGRSIRKIQRLARYASGTASYKTIELAQDIPHKKGYLELLGLATIQKKGSTWFLTLENPSIIPEMRTIIKEESIESITRISLSSNSQFSQGEGSEGNRFEKVPLDVEAEERTLDDTTNIKKNNNLQSEREKSGIKGNTELEPELQVLLEAKPLDSEPDKARIKWKVEPSG